MAQMDTKNVCYYYNSKLDVIPYSLFNIRPSLNVSAKVNLCLKNWQQSVVTHFSHHSKNASDKN